MNGPRFFEPPLPLGFVSGWPPSFGSQLVAKDCLAAQRSPNVQSKVAVIFYKVLRSYPSLANRFAKLFVYYNTKAIPVLLQLQHHFFGFPDFIIMLCCIQSDALTQPYLIFQVYVPDGHGLSLDVTITDLSNVRRRIVLSTSFKEVKCSPLHSTLPLLTVTPPTQTKHDTPNNFAKTPRTYHSKTATPLIPIASEGVCFQRNVVYLTS